MSESGVVELGSLGHRAVERLFARYEAALVAVPAGAPIPGSYWGAPEAGLDRAGVHARPDTPLHSILHELGHFVCAPTARRRELACDAGGDTNEECGVCYLQVVLADAVPGYDAERCLVDMDAWGYTFREGSAGAWFAGDGRDARAWLEREGLVDACGRPTWRLRE